MYTRSNTNCVQAVLFSVYKMSNNLYTICNINCIQKVQQMYIICATKKEDVLTRPSIFPYLPLPRVLSKVVAI